MSTTRYKLLNGGGVMLMKCWFGFLWRDHENYENHINKSEHRLHDLWVKMQTEKEHHARLLKQKRAIVKSIEGATGKQKGLGEPFAGKSFSGFRKPDVDAAPADWKEAFKGKQSCGSRPDSSYTLPSLQELGGVKAWDLTPAEKRSQGGNNSQNNNQNKQQNNNRNN